MKPAALMLFALAVSGCRPELTYYLEFRPNRVLVEGEETTLGLDIFRPNGFFGAVDVFADIKQPDGRRVSGAKVRVEDSGQVNRRNEIVVSLESVKVPSELNVFAYGDFEGERREATATLDLSLLGSWTLKAIPPVAETRRSSMVTIEVEATGFSVDGKLALEVEASSDTYIFHRGYKTIDVTTGGRNDVPIGSWSSSFVVPPTVNGEIEVKVQGSFAPTPPLMVMESRQWSRFVIRVNE
jgi:hypothetical protein